jgi:hypothetical protein
MDIIERIKCYLRANKYYKKYLQTRVNDMRYNYRSCRYYIKYYSFRKDKEVIDNTLYFIIDPAIKHPGLADRYKAIIGCYYISKINGFDFKIIYETPFHLNDYLDVNEYNWLSTRSDLSYSLKNSRIIPYNGGGKIPRLNKSVKQYHVYSYIGYDILETNRIQDYKTLWGTLYNSLFKPKNFILREIKETGFEKNKYIAVHLRFVNALEHFEGDQFNTVPEKKKEELIQRCFAGIRSIIHANEGIPVIVFSDSGVFLNRIKELPVHVLDGKIGHISFNNEKEIMVKTFLDFYMISEARKVYVIHAPELYATVYSYYAALVGYKDVITINV